RRKVAGTSERSCEYEPVVERQLSDGAACGGGDGDRSTPEASDRDTRPCAHAKGGGLARHRENRSHPLTGRDAAYAGPGVFGICLADLPSRAEAPRRTRRIAGTCA